MTEREHIFTRIREALRVAAPVSGQGHGKNGGEPDLPTAQDQRRVMPAVGQSSDERWALFSQNFADLKGDLRRVKDEASLVPELKAICAAEQWKKVAAHDAPMARTAAESLGVPVLMTDSAYDPTELAACDVGISECDALVAQTGTVLVTSHSAGGRALSCLPPHHVVLAKQEQLVPDLPAAFELLKSKYGGDYPSMISFITGPSRTGDIERILVLGAHGPKKLTILCR